jgi:hypothetical protein
MAVSCCFCDTVNFLIQLQNEELIHAKLVGGFLRQIKLLFARRLSQLSSFTRTFHVESSQRPFPLEFGNFLPRSSPKYNEKTANRMSAMTISFVTKSYSLPIQARIIIRTFHVPQVRSAPFLLNLAISSEYKCQINVPFSTALVIIKQTHECGKNKVG